MENNFFKFYNVYYQMNNRITNNEININNRNIDRLESANTKSTERIIVKFIGRDTIDSMKKVGAEKYKFDENYATEILAYNMFMSNYSRSLLQIIERKLQDLGHNISLKPNVRLSIGEFDRMIKSFLLNLKYSTKPYVLAHVFEHYFDTNNNYNFSADDQTKARDYMDTFYSACQEYYSYMLNYVMTDYIKPSTNEQTSTRQNVNINSILVG